MTTPESPLVSIRVSRYPGDENPRTIGNVHDFDVSENGFLAIDFDQTTTGFNRVVYAPAGWSDLEVVGLPNRVTEEKHNRPGRGPRR